MRLTYKLNLGLLLVVCSVIAFQSQQRIRRELDLFEAETRRDHHVMGRVLRHAVEDEWADGGEAAARALVHRVNQREEGVTIRWVEISEGAPLEVRPSSLDAATAAMSGGEARFFDQE